MNTLQAATVRLFRPLRLSCWLVCCWGCCLAPLPLLAGCAGTSSREGLEEAVKMYNEGLRWKRFAVAAKFVADERRAHFVERCAASEDDLHIESLQVRAVSPVGLEEDETFEVVVAAELYRLPSTVLEKKVFVQRWQGRGSTWRMMGSEPELIPLLEGS